jgi:hypothetical protein
VPGSSFTAVGGVRAVVGAGAGDLTCVRSVTNGGGGSGCGTNITSSSLGSGGVVFSKRLLAAATPSASSPSPGLWARRGINDGSQPAIQPAIIHASMTSVPLPWCVDDSGGSSLPFRGFELLRHLRRGRCRRRRTGPSRAITPRTQPAVTTFCRIVTPLTAGRITARTRLVMLCRGTLCTQLAVIVQNGRRVRSISASSTTEPSTSRIACLGLIRGHWLRIRPEFRLCGINSGSISKGWNTNNHCWDGAKKLRLQPLIANRGLMGSQNTQNMRSHPKQRSGREYILICLPFGR